METALAIGLMSGTSLDGVDTALVDFSGSQPVVRATHFAAFSQALREELLALQSAGPNEIERAALAANNLARAYASGVEAVLLAANIPATDVCAIGAHGQTVRHRPELGFTVQVNSPALLAELTNITVVADFRSRDVAAGGQGAPLAPAFHQAFFASATERRAVINIGGIANVTLLGTDGGTRGFDTGPGNVLMDLWCERHTGQAFDDSGAWAQSGQIIPMLLDALLDDPYFSRPAPKSTGRDLFNPDWLAERLNRTTSAGTTSAGTTSAGTTSAGTTNAGTTNAGTTNAGPFAPQDVQATLLELTARSIVDCMASEGVDAIFVCGGGARNARLMDRLQALMGGKPVRSTSAIGVPPDWVEAVAFAWFGLQTLRGIPANLPQVTGALGLRVLGAVYPA